MTTNSRTHSTARKRLCPAIRYLTFHNICFLYQLGELGGEATQGNSDTVQSSKVEILEEQVRLMQDKLSKVRYSNVLMIAGAPL